MSQSKLVVMMTGTRPRAARVANACCAYVGAYVGRTGFPGVLLEVGAKEVAPGAVRGRQSGQDLVLARLLSMAKLKGSGTHSVIGSTRFVMRG
jgi:hypothetical protein